MPKKCRKQGKCFYAPLILLLLVMVSYSAKGQAPDAVAGIPVNYDEADVGKYQLPDPLMLANGETVDNAETWYEKRRPQII